MDVLGKVAFVGRCKSVRTERPARACKPLLINCRAEVTPYNHCGKDHSDRNKREDHHRLADPRLLGILLGHSQFTFLSIPALIRSTQEPRKIGSFESARTRPLRSVEPDHNSISSRTGPFSSAKQCAATRTGWTRYRLRHEAAHGAVVQATYKIENAISMHFLSRQD